MQYYKSMQQEQMIYEFYPQIIIVLQVTHLMNKFTLGLI
jgi:hypothetical protein